MRSAFCALLIAGSAAGAQTVTQADGLAAWERIYEVASHPRCTNCHVGAQDAPMWEGLTYRVGAVHGMGVEADESRIGAESMPCRTCHVSAAGRNVASPSAPQIDDAWRLPPVALGWLGKGPLALCQQLRDVEQSDGNDTAELVAHVQRSPFVAWGFAPGEGRSAPSGNVGQLAADLAIWGAAGAPCE